MWAVASALERLAAEDIDGTDSAQGSRDDESKILANVLRASLRTPAASMLMFTAQRSHRFGFRECEKSTLRFKKASTPAGVPGSGKRRS